MPIGFEWSREAPPEFVARLHHLFPPYGRSQWMEPVWDAGTPEDPIQRWAVYVATPAHMLSQFERDEIEAKNLSVLPPCVAVDAPLAVARAVEMGIDTVPFRECPQGRRRALGFWEVHRATLLPFWVVQGEGGGHPYRYQEHERRLLRLAQLPDEEPEPGSLPFHPLDERVLNRVVALDRLRRRIVDQKAGDRAQDDEQEREWRFRFLEFVTSTTDHVFGEMSEILARCGLTGDGRAPFERDAEAKYVETGSFA